MEGQSRRRRSDLGGAGVAVGVGGDGRPPNKEAAEAARATYLADKKARLAAEAKAAPVAYVRPAKQDASDAIATYFASKKKAVEESKNANKEAVASFLADKKERLAAEPMRHGRPPIVDAAEIKKLTAQAADIYVEHVIREAAASPEAKVEAAARVRDRLLSTAQSAAAKAAGFSASIVFSVTKSLVSKKLNDAVVVAVESTLGELTHPVVGQVAAFGLRLVIDYAIQQAATHGAQVALPEPLFRYFVKQREVIAAATSVAEKSAKASAAAPPPPTPQVEGRLRRVLEAGERAFERQFGQRPYDMLRDWIGAELVAQITQATLSLLLTDKKPAEILSELLTSGGVRDLLFGDAWQGTKKLAFAGGKKAAAAAGHRLLVFSLTSLSDKTLVETVGKRLAARLRASELGKLKLEDADFLGIVEKVRARLRARGTADAQLAWLDATVADLMIGVSTRVQAAAVTAAESKVASTVYVEAQREFERRAKEGLKMQSIAEGLSVAGAVAANSFYSLVADGADVSKSIRDGIARGVSAFWSAAAPTTEAPATAAPDTTAPIAEAPVDTRESATIRASKRVAARRRSDLARVDEANERNYDLVNEQLQREQREAQRLVETGEDADALSRFNAQVAASLDARNYADLLTPSSTKPKREPLDAARLRALRDVETLGEGVTFRAPGRSLAYKAVDSYTGRFYEWAKQPLRAWGTKYDATRLTATIANNLARIGISRAIDATADGSVANRVLNGAYDASQSVADGLKMMPAYAKVEQEVASMLTGGRVNLDDMVDAREVAAKFASNVLLDAVTRGTAGMDWRTAGAEAAGDLAFGLSSSRTAAQPSEAWQATRAGAEVGARAGFAIAKSFVDGLTDVDATARQAEAAAIARIEITRRAKAEADEQVRLLLAESRAKREARQERKTLMHQQRRRDDDTATAF